MLDEKTIASVLETYGDNLDMAIEKLEQLQLNGNRSQDVNGEVDPTQHIPEPSNGAEVETPVETRIYQGWVDNVLQDLYRSESQEDSRRRLENALRAFEDAAIENYKDNSEEMKEAKKQFESMKKNFGIVCKALTNRQEQFKTHGEEMANLRAVLHQAEEKIRALELSNFSLTVHLERAIGPKVNDPGAPPPDIF